MNLTRRALLATLLVAGCAPRKDMTLNIRAIGKPVRQGVELTDSDTAGYPGTGNINFMSIIEVESWMTGLVANGISAGRLLYAWGSHNGHCVYLGHKASIGGTVTMLSSTSTPSKCLSLGRTSDSHNGFGLLALNPDWGAQGSSNDHFSSPHFILTPGRSLMKCYFHGTAQKTGTSDGWTHGAGVALSGPDLSLERAQIVAGLMASTLDGGFVVPTGFANAGSSSEAHITAYVATVVADVPSNEIGWTWRISPLRIGQGTGGAAHYLRVFVVRGEYYAISNQGELRRSEIGGIADTLGVWPFVQRSNQDDWSESFEDTGQSPTLLSRHHGLLRRGDWITSSISRPQDADPNNAGPPYPDQEHIQFFDFSVADDWSTWKAGPVYGDLRSETSDENVSVALDGAHGGAVPANLRLLLDGYFYPEEIAEDDNETTVYFFYCVSEDRFKRATWNEKISALP